MKTFLRYCLFLGFCFLCNVTILAQTENYFSGFQTPLSKNASHSNAGDSVKWTEQEAERTVFSSTYKSDDGQIKIIYAKQAINFYNSKKQIIPINKDLEPLTRLTWSAQNQPFPTYLHHDGSFGITMDNGKVMTLGKNCKINNSECKNDFIFTGNQNTIKNVLPGIDKQLIFSENAIKYNYVINNQNSIGNGPLVISEDLKIPDTYRLIYNVSNGSKTTDGWAGDLIVVNEKGETVSTIYAPICYDANNDYVVGAYSFSQEQGMIVLKMHVPANWINSEERAYPIIVDPVVTGPTSTWAGGTMPSCILPAYNVDSIQVTIPAAITITSLDVTGSFYADPFTTAVMSQGSMYFSTSCGNSVIFTITGTTANLPGTGYLDAYDLHNPLTCCYPESCSTQSFWLTMHLGRTGPGTGCNTTYIRYDPFTTSWPFKAVVIGRTAETYGGKWVVSQNPICSNTCTITGNAYSLYGVPPYTYSHPWSSEVVTQGTNTGCGTGSNYYHFTLTIPDCPNYCDESFTTLTVPPPTIIDACGNVVTGIPSVDVPIKTAPQVSLVYDSVVCSGDPFQIDLDPCVPGATLNWYGNGGGGNEDFTDSIANSGTSMSSTNYASWAESNGCWSDTLNFTVYTEPLPIANYSNTPEMAILTFPIEFQDISILNGATINSWNWTFDDNTTSTVQNPTHTYDVPGIYTVCLDIVTDNGCWDQICKEITVAPAKISIPNVVTPNGDDANDLLIFEYLDFYPENELTILNRWGDVVLSKTGYQNDWNGSNYSEGVYFYTLTINGDEKKYSGFFHLIK